MRSLEQVSFQSQPGPFAPLCYYSVALGAQPLPRCAAPGGGPQEVRAAAEFLSAEVGPFRPLFLSCSLLEESYVMRDPFTPAKGRFLVVGSRCSMCGRLVCVGPVGKPRAPGAASSLHPVAGTSRVLSGEVTLVPFPGAV